MSDIEIGSVWVVKGDDKIIATVSRLMPENKALQYKTSTGWTTSSVEWFLEDFKRKETDEEFCDRKNQELKDDMSTIYDQPEPQGRKDDSAKPRYSLLPSGTVNEVVKVLEYGCIKYSPENWQTVPSARTRYYDAAMRHIDAWWNGEKADSETGFHHLAHATCCLFFLMWFDNEQP